MNIRMLIRRDAVVYPFLFAMWALVIGLMHGNYRYFGTPFPSATMSQVNDSRAQSIANDISRMAAALLAEKNPGQRARLEANIGGAYTELYRLSRRSASLDSAQRHFEGSLAIDPGLQVAHYMLGMALLEKNDPSAASQHFAKEVELYSAGSAGGPAADQATFRTTAALSCFQLAALYSSALKNPGKAQEYFNRYCRLETDAKRKQDALRELGKYGVVTTDNGPSR
jgi:tetratricopeptide (TPR) repeat protein